MDIQTVDLRSDTVTKPSKDMRAAIAAADVGDDVFGEDPSINELQERMASLLGFEAGIFVPTATMSNLIAVGVHASGRGEEVILGDNSHIFLYECGGASVYMNVAFHTVPNDLQTGELPLENVEAAIRSENVHFPRTAALLIENTHNKAGGAPLTCEYTQECAALCRRNNLKLHIDGSRLFNAAAALKVEPRSLTGDAGADSVTICLSKGLGCPAGSVLCGSAAFVAQARRVRKALGGGMRQAGVLAAAGLYSLDNDPISLLVTDHNLAHRLAQEIDNISGLEVTRAQTNMVFFQVTRDTNRTAPELSAWLKGKRVLINAYSDTLLRAVTHRDVDAADIDRALRELREFIGKSGSSL